MKQPPFPNKLVYNAEIVTAVAVGMAEAVVAGGVAVSVVGGDKTKDDVDGLSESSPRDAINGRVGTSGTVDGGGGASL